VGDVITYKPPLEVDFLVTHRVIEVLRKDNILGFRTQGDAVDKPDDFVIPAENVVGQVWFYIPLFGYFARFVKTPVGTITCFLIPSILLIAGELY
jgi:signal peptidase I